MTTLEQLNRDCPEHDRDSCSDEHPINAGVDLRYGHALCRRCQGLWQIKAETALELQEAQQWQPMERAPKDEWVMLLMPEVKHPWHGPRIVFAHWFTSEYGVSEWCWPENPCDLYTERGREYAMKQLEEGELYSSSEPTGWKRLPALTSDAAKVKQGGV